MKKGDRATRAVDVSVLICSSDRDGGGGRGSFMADREGPRIELAMP